MADVMTFDDVLIDYFFSKVLRPATEWSYRKVVKTFIEFSGDDTLPGNVTRLDVLKWRRHVLTEQGSCKRTWNNKLAHMRAIFNHAIKYQLIANSDNPFRLVVVNRISSVRRP